MDCKIKKIAMQEANDRMRLLGIREEDIRNFGYGELTKVYVNHSEKRLNKESLTPKELEMIMEVEEEKDVLVYYVIKDKGVWPDGAEFERYTLAIVDTYIDDFAFVKEDCIKGTLTLPAYIINAEDPGCSGREEFGFKIINGYMINIT